MKTTNATRAEAGNNTTHPARLLQSWLAGNNANGLFSRAAAVKYLAKATGLPHTKVAGIVHRFSDTTSEFGIRKARRGPIKVRNYSPRNRTRLSSTQAELVFFKGLADLKLNVPVVSFTAIHRATKLSKSVVLRLLSAYAKRSTRGGRKAPWYLQSVADDRARELGIHLPWMPEWLEPVETVEPTLFDTTGYGAMKDDPVNQTLNKRTVAEEDIPAITIEARLDLDTRVLAPMLWLTGVAGGCAVLAVVAAAAAIYGVM